MRPEINYHVMGEGSRPGDAKFWNRQTRGIEHVETFEYSGYSYGVHPGAYFSGTRRMRSVL